jgi:hypothetical protein
MGGMSGPLGWVYETTGTDAFTLKLYAPDPGVSWGRKDWGWCVFRWAQFRDGWGWLSADAGTAATEEVARAAAESALAELEAGARG